MSGYQGIENNRILIDLTQAALSTGWSVSGTVATHDACNPGTLYLLNYPLVIGQAYRYTYIINYITSGYVQASLGSQRTMSGLIVESGVATETKLSFFANGNCQITQFAIEPIAAPIGIYAQNTIAWAEKINKWTSFYTKAPESAYSMFTKTVEFMNGDAYLVESGSADRCNFFGIQYPSTIYFSTNQQPSLAKTYLTTNYQANQLLITPPSGINTSYGQVSELIAVDFLQEVYADAISPSVFIYDAEGLYKASFMRSYPDLINGDQLKGNYLTMGLQTTAPSGLLILFTTEVEYEHSYQNIR